MEVLLKVNGKAKDVDSIEAQYDKLVCGGDDVAGRDILRRCAQYHTSTKSGKILLLDKMKDAKDFLYDLQMRISLHAVKISQKDGYRLAALFICRAADRLRVTEPDFTELLIIWALT